MNKKKQLYWVASFIVGLIALRLLLGKYGNFDTLLATISNLYTSFGPLFLFLAGLLEATVLIGLYVPGATVILMGATLAGAKIIPLPMVIVWTTPGIIVGYVISYYIGVLGWEKVITRFGFDESLIEKAGQRAKQSHWIYLWSTFHPDFGAVASLALGIIKTDFRKFLILITLCQFFWSTFWGIIFYSFGMILLKKIAFVVGIVLICSILFELLNFFHHHHKL
jgi:membrane protein DedA with SNARE-associated domain